MEAGDDEETVRAARLHSDHPAARLIAIGMPQAQDLFDAVCPQPVTADALSEALNAEHVDRVQVS